MDFDFKENNSEVYETSINVDETIYEGQTREYISRAKAEIGNSYPSLSECKKFINYFESIQNKNDDILSLIYCLKHKFIYSAIRYNQKFELTTATKYLEDLERLEDQRNLRTMLEAQEKKNKIMELYLEGLLTSYAQVKISEFENNALNFSLVIGRFVIATKNSFKVKDLADEYLKEIIRENNEDAYNKILQYLPVYISTRERIDPFIVENLEQLVTLNELFKQDLMPYLIQLRKKMKKAENRAKSLRDRIRELFKL